MSNKVISSWPLALMIVIIVILNNFSLQQVRIIDLSITELVLVNTRDVIILEKMTLSFTTVRIEA